MTYMISTMKPSTITIPFLWFHTVVSVVTGRIGTPLIARLRLALSLRVGLGGILCSQDSPSDGELVEVLTEYPFSGY
jgi:hypothetical protein